MERGGVVTRTGNVEGKDACIKMQELEHRISSGNSKHQKESDLADSTVH